MVYDSLLLLFHQLGSELASEGSGAELAIE